MKKKDESMRKAYMKPEISIVQVEEEERLLAGSPPVQPGKGGGQSGTTPGNIRVIEAQEEVGEDGDELVG